MSETAPKPEAEMKGWLHKWTNYIKGYQKRWFVLSGGLLSYYRTQAEMTHTCRGTISLHGAIIHTEDACNFVISNGGTQTFHLKASTEVERQRWVTALELAKAKAIRVLESEDEEEFDESPAQPDKSELQAVIRLISSKLEDLSTCNDLIVKHGAGLQRSLSELENLETTNDAPAKLKAVNERATLFRITCNAMMNACSEYLDLAQGQGRKWQRMLQHERDQRVRLEEMVEQLARQHSQLEQVAKEHTQTNHAQNLTDGKASSASDEDEEGEFHDALDDPGYIVHPSHRHSHPEISKEEIKDSQANEDKTDELESPVKEKELVSKYSFNQQRRRKIPDKPNYPLNLWSIMKNCIGKELTKIPMPVNFSEPLSMLQRLTEEFEYSDILDKAAMCKDPHEQLAYVAAFTVSAYASTSYRTGKPFNPLLGETYECDRINDLGWRAVSEQVSHHPPMVAQYCEGKKWSCWQEFTMSSKFRGKYLQIIPLGSACLSFDGTKNHYTWRKVTTTVHNIIVGKLWIDQSGEMDIINHRTQDKCHLKFLPYSYFNREPPRKVTGYVMDKDGTISWVISGFWDSRIDAAKVLSTSNQDKGKPILETGTFKTLWKVKPLAPDSEKYFNMSEFACQLNEPEEGVSPTDSRRRPDQRLMEEGHWEEANCEKVRLEEKQRAARKMRESMIESDNAGEHSYRPSWFRLVKDPVTNSYMHEYNGEYWECKEKQEWTRSPDIF